MMSAENPTIPMVDDERTSLLLPNDLPPPGPGGNGPLGQAVKQTNYNSISGMLSQPVTLSWENLSYSVDVGGGMCRGNGEKKRILRNVSGVAKPGELLAIIGSSGAGKSTLLDILAGRKNTGNIEGKVLVNGRPPDRLFNRMSGYVYQDDCLMGTQTVKETLRFNADLKLSGRITRYERECRVSDVINELGLAKVRDSKIGTQFNRGLSGGEKKRVNVACEMITDPSLLFVDEPTTGLDGYNAFSVMESLHNLANQGRTIVCTIHQPRSTIFDLFDRLMILSQGRCVYFGPARDAVAYFSGLNIECPRFNNPADFFIDVVNASKDARAVLPGGDGDDVEETAVPARDNYTAIVSNMDLAETFANSECARSLSTSIASVMNDHAASIGDDSPTEESLHSAFQRTGSRFARAWPVQFWYLAARALRNISRNPLVTYVQLIQTVFMGVLAGSIYWQLGLGQTSVQNRIGVLFFGLTNQAFSQMSSLALFMNERLLFKRESEGGTYRISAYYLAKTLTEAPFFLVFPAVFSSIVYWSAGLQAVFTRFLIYVLAECTITCVAASMFLMIGAFSPSITIAQIIAPVLNVLFLLFGGFFINTANIPVYYTPIHYLSFFKYAFEIIAYNEMTGLTFTCTSAQENCNGDECTCPIPDGDAELEILGFDKVNIWLNFAILGSMVVGYRILAYIFLRFLNRGQ
eukprot:TRINITY_DN6684_c0_g1_i1.p1 TRINITY_DN6684_c0_g1~~TRINITY_DN6684_c0_g1_i1.p1  ORF type:complete len:692 (+),score=176.21 TRINITY_DN6684_c0_g1_i1:91-2166(+)